jgi:hypothetical protein
MCSRTRNAIFLRAIFFISENGLLKHLDGTHRLLAWALFEIDQEVHAYVAGRLPSI